MFIHDEEIRKIAHDKNSIEWGKRHHQDYGIFEEYKIIEDYEGIYIEAMMDSANYYGNVELNIAEDGSVGEHGCDCYYHRDDKPCRHVIAALYYFNAIVENKIYTYEVELERPQLYTPFKSLLLELKDNQEYAKKQQLKQQLQSKTFKSKQLVESLLNKGKDKMMLDNDKERYHLKVSLRYIGSNRSNAKYELGLKVGEDKMYVIQDIDLFLKRIQQQTFFAYGQQLAFTHCKEVFDKSSQKVIDYLAECIMYESFYQPMKRYIFINENMLDSFYETFANLNKISYFQFQETTFNETLRVEKLDEYYKLKLKPNSKLIISNNNFYYLEDRKIKRIKLSQPQVVKEVYNSLCDDVWLSRNDYIVFINYLKSAIGSSLKIIGKDGMSEYIEERITIHADLEDDYLLLECNQVYSDASIKSLFGLQTEIDSINVEQVKTIIESYHPDVDKENGNVRLPLSETTTVIFIEKVLTMLNTYAEVYVSDRIKQFNRRKQVQATIGVRIRNNLLEIKVEDINCKPKELDGILKSYREKRNYYRLKNGEIISLEGQAIEELDELVNDLNITTDAFEDGVVEVPVYQAFQLENKLKSFEEITGKSEDSFKKFIDTFQNFSEEDIKIHSQYSSILKDYQQQGVKWMMLLSKYQLGGILADDMGLGKTLQTIALLESVHQKESTHIIITPASLLLNWKDELDEFNSNLNYACINGTKQQREEMINQIEKYDVVITTYDYLIRDIDFYDSCKFNHIILDEAQYIKNPKTKAARSVKELSGDVRFALSGTLIENTLSELWSIFDFLMPTYLHNYHHFRTYYELPIVHQQDLKIQKKLKQRVEPFMLRRLKKDVLNDLPDKEERNIEFSFAKEEEKLYVAKLAQANEDLERYADQNENNSIEVLRLLMQLRQICCEPRLLFSNVNHISSKMQGCLSLVEDLKKQRKKVLIFSSFTSILSLMVNELDKRNISYFVLTGSCSKKERKEMNDKFQKGEVDVFLISLKAGGVGLNLTKAEAVIHFDPWWNVSAQNQATDRAYRIGQDNKVIVYNLIMKNSIEEKIISLQQKKKELSNTFVENSNGSVVHMKPKEVMNLIKRT